MPGKVEMKRRENRCILRIVKAKVEYEGEYACIVDGDETYCEITVEEPNWYFTRELRPQEALEGDASATFECDVSEREAEVRWYKGDKVRARSFTLPPVHMCALLLLTNFRGMRLRATSKGRNQ